MPLHQAGTDLALQPFHMLAHRGLGARQLPGDSTQAADATHGNEHAQIIEGHEDGSYCLDLLKKTLGLTWRLATAKIFIGSRAATRTARRRVPGADPPMYDASAVRTVLRSAARRLLLRQLLRLLLRHLLRLLLR